MSAQSIAIILQWSAVRNLPTCGRVQIPAVYSPAAIDGLRKCEDYVKYESASRAVRIPYQCVCMKLRQSPASVRQDNTRRIQDESRMPALRKTWQECGCVGRCRFVMMAHCIRPRVVRFAPCALEPMRPAGICPGLPVSRGADPCLSPPVTSYAINHAET